MGTTPSTSIQLISFSTRVEAWRTRIISRWGLMLRKIVSRHRMGLPMGQTKPIALHFLKAVIVTPSRRGRRPRCVRSSQRLHQDLRSVFAELQWARPVGRSTPNDNPLVADLPDPLLGRRLLVTLL